jgi:hypothetical protein
MTRRVPQPHLFHKDRVGAGDDLTGEPNADTRIVCGSHHRDELRHVYLSSERFRSVQFVGVVLDSGTEPDSERVAGVQHNVARVELGERCV